MAELSLNFVYLDIQALDRDCARDVALIDTLVERLKYDSITLVFAFPARRSKQCLLGVARTRFFVNFDLPQLPPQLVR